MFETPRSLEPGELLADRYRLVRVLGHGGMGVVWEARQITTGRPVAIKVLKDSGPHADRASAVRLLREARVAASLSHRNIVQVFDYWEVDDGPVFIVMELLVGEPLSELLARRGRLDVATTAALLAPVASALRAAHARGVVHRDVKPENIFLARVGNDGTEGDSTEVKVVDFGLAKPQPVFEAHDTAITQTGALMGTPFYMSPEQVYGQKDIDARSDVWSLGVVLYECLAGVRPFAGENFGQVFRGITQEHAQPVRELVPHVPRALDRLVSMMLAHGRDERPAMADVRDALAAADAAPTDGGDALATARRGGYDAPVRRRRQAIFGITAATVAIVMATLGLVTRADRRPAPPPAVASVAPFASRDAPIVAASDVPDPAPIAVDDHGAADAATKRTAMPASRAAGTTRPVTPPAKHSASASTTTPTTPTNGPDGSDPLGRGRF